MNPSRRVSTKADDMSDEGSGQPSTSVDRTKSLLRGVDWQKAVERTAGFSERLKARAEQLGLSQADLVRLTPLGRSQMSKLFAGTGLVGSDNLFPLADALQVDARWLVSGEAESAPFPAVVEPRPHQRMRLADESDWLFLPRYDLLAFTAEGKPDALEQLPVRRDWIARAVRTSANLWLAEMPSNAMDDVAAEGDTIICKDPQLPVVDGRVYAWYLDGRVIVRRLSIGRDGFMLKAADHNMDPIHVPADEADTIRPVARILAALVLRPA